MHKNTTSVIKEMEEERDKVNADDRNNKQNVKISVEMLHNGKLKGLAFG